MSRYDYRCVKCHHEWRGEKPQGEKCPACGSATTKRVYATAMHFHPSKGR